MRLERAQVEKVANLARLKLDEAGLARLETDLTAILGYIDQLNAVDTDGVEPLAHPLPLRNVFREDEIKPSLPVDEALANAPKRAGDFFAVPAILD
jgi:aspartyl-tRNA(Asn)/glutamyl-tRNA(Gln) amidotransferase subunit C